MGGVSFSVLLQKRAGRTKEQGENENVMLSLDSFTRVHCCVLPRAEVNVVVSLFSDLSSSCTLICTPCFFSSFSLQLSVDTLQFLLFLYIQQLNRVSLRTSLIGEEWPSHRTRSPSPSDREAKTSSQNKVTVTVNDKRQTCN